MWSARAARVKDGRPGLNRLERGCARSAGGERIASLTPRERQVATLVAEGLRNKDIATRLFVSDITVRHHLTSIFAKLEVSDRLELVLYAFRHGLATPPR